MMLLPLFTACPSQTEEKIQTYENVKSLFLINTSRIDKTVKDSWFTISAHSRSTNAGSMNTYETKILRTPVFAPDYSRLSAVRSSNPLPPKKFSVGNEHAFQNDFDFYLKTQKVFKCVYEGEYCYIWVCPEEKNDPEIYLTDEEIIFYANKFDQIYVKETAMCGSKYDGTSAESLSGLARPSQKISLVFGDIDGDREEAWYGGYYTLSDIYENADNPSANQIEAIHIDSYLAKKEETRNSVCSTIAHEFNHKLNFDNKYIKYGLEMDMWFTEMLSLTIEDLFYEDFGLTAIDSSPSRLYSFSKGSFNYGFKNWIQRDDPVVENSDYANAYAFGAFLARNYGGPQLIHEIATNEYVNEEAVVHAVKKVTGKDKTFAELLSEFPLVIINLNGENKELPTLNKTVTSTVGGIDYKLNALSVEAFEEATGEKYEIQTNSLESKKIALGAYGFQYFSFEKPTDITINISEDAKDYITIVAK